MATLSHPCCVWQYNSANALCCVCIAANALLQVNDMNEASTRDFAARLEAAAAAAPGSSSKVELRSAVKDREYEALSATVNGLSACPHHVSWHVAEQHAELQTGGLLTTCRI